MKNQKNYQNKFIFEYLKNILKTKSLLLYKEHIEDKENFKSFPSVVILRYLSMCQDYKVRDIILKNQIYLERLDSISHESLYKWCILNIPKQYNTFIKYIK